MSAARITGLYVYPVKSCRGVSLTKMELGKTGPLFDRQWMLVDAENNFISLRTNSNLSQIKTHIHGAFLHLYFGSNKVLVNTSEECENLEEISVWNDKILAGVESQSINDSLSDFLGKTVKLVRYQKQSFRDLKNAGTLVVKETMFADARPILLINQNSIENLNEKLKMQGSDETHFERFRANIIVDGLKSYSEDEAKEVIIKTANGPISLTHTRLCARCPVITQDVESGKIISKETLKILADERKIPGSSKVPFGINLTPAALGTISLGDTVEFL